MSTPQSQFATTARTLVATLKRLNTLCENYMAQGKALGLGTTDSDVGGTLHAQRLSKELKAAVLLGLPAVRLSGQTDARTRAKFHGARLAGIEKPLVERLPG